MWRLGPAPLARAVRGAPLGARGGPLSPRPVSAFGARRSHCPKPSVIAPTAVGAGQAGCLVGRLVSFSLTRA